MHVAIDVPLGTQLTWNNPTAYVPTKQVLSFRGANNNWLDTVNTVVVDGVVDLDSDPDTTTVTVPMALDYETPYFWKVESYEPNDVEPFEEVVYTSSTWTFISTPAVPLIIEQPFTLPVVSGVTSLDLTVAAVTTDVYEWYRVDSPADVLVQTTGTLGMLGADTDTFTTDVDGYYYCVVSNENGSEQSDVIHVMMPQLVAYWNFDNNLTDSVNGFIGVYTDPNENNADPTPDPVYTAVDDAGNLSGAGQALVLDGNNDQLFVEVADSNEFFNFYPNGYTVSAWAKMDESGYGALVSKQAFARNQGFVLNHLNSNATHTLRNTSVTEAAPTSIRDGQWHMITGTYEPVSRKVTLFVDGLEVGSGVRTSDPLPNDQSLLFGCGLNDGRTSPYSGYLDEVRIWNYPVDSVEIAYWYQDHNTGDTVCIDQAALIYDVAGGPDDEFGNSTGDCKIDVADFAEIIARNWLACGLVDGYCLEDTRPVDQL